MFSPVFSLTALFSALATPWALAQGSTPSAPGLTFLYTLNCTLGTPLDIGYGPRGHRVAIPIIGGYFNGPRLSGNRVPARTRQRLLDIWQTTQSVLLANTGRPSRSGNVSNLGADWGITDNNTGIFSADTRYNLVTDDGANIFIQTSGPKQTDGHIHLREIFETGSPDYYWLNDIVAVGILTSGDGWVSIDSWQLDSPAA